MGYHFFGSKVHSLIKIMFKFAKFSYNKKSILGNARVSFVIEREAVLPKMSAPVHCFPTSSRLFPFFFNDCPCPFLELKMTKAYPTRRKAVYSKCLFLFCFFVFLFFLKASTTCNSELKSHFSEGKRVFERRGHKNIPHVYFACKNAIFFGCQPLCRYPPHRFGDAAAMCPHGFSPLWWFPPEYQHCNHKKNTPRKCNQNYTLQYGTPKCHCRYLPSRHVFAWLFCAPSTSVYCRFG